MKYIFVNYQDVSVKHLEKANQSESLLMRYVEGPYVWAQKFPNELKVMLLFYYLSTFNEEYKKLNTKIKVPNLGDHRICMSAMILGLLTGIPTNIKNFETVFTSSPSFLKIMKNNLGVTFEIKN